MAVTTVLVNATPYHLVYECTDDGGGGQANIDNAELVAAAIAAESPALKAHFQTEVTSNAAARLLLQQLDPGEMYIVSHDADGWGVQGNNDEGDLPEVNVWGGGAASVATLVIGIKHSLVK
jgi:hypothetical protein